MCEQVFFAIEWTEEDCRPSIKQTVEGCFFFMHSKVEDIEGVRHMIMDIIPPPPLHSCAFGEVSKGTFMLTPP